MSALPMWPKEVDAYVGKPSLQLFATCGAGALHPTVLFSTVRDLLDKEAIIRTCLDRDDLWLKAMQLVASIPVVVAEEYQGLRYVPGSQDSGLCHRNEDSGENDRQLLQIEEEINRRYGKDTFRKKLLDTTVGESLIGAEALSNLIRFYKTRANEQVNQLKQQYSKYSTLRIDIRNIGSEDANVLEKSVVPEPISLRRPQWIKNGITVESATGKMKLVLQCQGDGALEIRLMGRDVRNAEGMRYPIWIDCTRFAVNSEVIFNDTKTVCNDKRYVYRRKVVDGEIVTLDFVWSECQSPSVLDEYRQLQADLKNANAKVNKTEAALKNANAKVSSTEAALKNANIMIVSLQKKLLATREDNSKLKAWIKSLKGSVSFKVGRSLTWLPRKLRGGAKCLKQHGLSFTVKRTIEHLGIDLGTKDSKKK